MNFLFSHSVFPVVSTMFTISSDNAGVPEKLFDIKVISSFPAIHFLLLGVLC